MACSSPSPHKQLATPQRIPPPDAAVDAAPLVLDFGPEVPRGLGEVGAACTLSDHCVAGLMCQALDLPSGYCATTCGVVPSRVMLSGKHDERCNACVDTRSGELCARSCSSDRDCRTAEGYVCDRQWHACLVPNFAAIKPQLCGANVRDTSFGASEPWSTAAAPGVYQFQPTAVLTDDGGLVAVYDAEGKGADGADLGLARMDAKGTLTVDVRLAGMRVEHGEPRLARGRKGTLFVAWSGSSRGPKIDLAKSLDGGVSWTPGRAVHDASDCAGASPCVSESMLAVGIDPKTKSELVHVLYAAGAYGLRVRTSRNGGDSFATGPIVLTGTRGNATATSDGKLHVVAMTGSALGAYGSAMQKIEYTASADGGTTFTAPVTVSGHLETLPYFFSNPSITVDTARRWIYVAYARGGRDGAWDIVVAASKDGGATWRRTKLAGDGCAIHMVPNLALDARTGTLHVAYYDSEGALGRFVHASCATGVKQCKIHGAINGVPFATLSLARHSSKWVGEHQSLLVDDKRRVLHAVWAQPVDEAGKPVTRIFHAQAKLNK